MKGVYEFILCSKKLGDKNERVVCKGTETKLDHAKV